MLVAVQDDGSRKVYQALSQLRRIGGYRILRSYRGSYALTGYVGFPRKPRWSVQVQRKTGKGPSQLSASVRIPGVRRGLAFAIDFDLTS